MHHYLQLIDKLISQLRRQRKQPVLSLILAGITLALMLQTQPLHSQSSYYGYMPAVKSRIIAEVGLTWNCRWPHNNGQTTNLYYKWGDRLQVLGSQWRIAFQSAIDDWNAKSTKMHFNESSSGTIILNTYDDPADDSGGYATPQCNGTTTVGFTAMANLATHTSSTANNRRKTAGHELGHTYSVAHIPSKDFTAIMSYWPDWEIYFTPAQADVDFVNQIYP